jgi:3-isopropylmalate/(R)-2-methylmalate dehydratase large subunit
MRRKRVEKSFVERILGSEAGKTASVKPDMIIVNDGISSAVVDLVSRVASPPQVMVIYDHDVPTGSSEAAGVFIKINRFAKQFGLEFVQGKGISYQYLLDEAIQSGQIIAGGGSHASIFGAKGALGINLSLDDLKKAIETGSYEITVPETVRINIEGDLGENVDAMDAGFAFLAENRTIAGKAIEFSGGSLPSEDLAILCSMTCVTGAFTASVGDSKEHDCVLNLSTVKPMIMLPCGERNEQHKAEIEPLQTLAGTPLNAGQIGGYTGGTISQLRRAASRMEGKRLALGFRLSVCPATSRDYLMAMEERLIEKFLDYGAQIHAAGDHSVVTQGPGTVDSYESLITTGLYTFDGCMGVKGAKVYSASVDSVIAASAVKTIMEV